MRRSTIKTSGLGNGHGMYGSQTTERKMEQLFNFEKGLLSNLDIGLQPPNAFTVAENATISSMPGSNQTPMAVFQSPPLAGNMFQTFTYGDTTFRYQTTPYVDWIATLEPGVQSGESIVFSGTGTGSIITSISQGDNCIQLAMTASQTVVATDTISNTHPALPTYPNSATYPLKLAVDTNWTNHANFSAGTIRVGLDASNYFFWNISAPSTDGNHILFFPFATPDGTVGTPGVGPYTYCRISLTATAGGTLTVKMSNVRKEAITTSGNYRPQAANIYSAYPFVKQKSTNTRQLVLATANTLLIQVATNQLGFVDSGQSLTELKTGFTNACPATTNSINNGSFFVFCQFPQVLNQDLNNLYYVNGADGYMVYDPSLTKVPPTAISVLTQTAGIATATVANSFTVGQYVSVSGANEAGYNGNVIKVLTASGSQFTYAVDPGTASPATGSPVVFVSQNTQISTIKFTCLAAHKNYMWLAGDPLNPNTLYPSILATPNVIDNASAVTIADPSGSSFITALIPFDDYLIIFRNTDIWVMLGATTGVGGDIAIRRTQSQFGALNPFCAVNTGDTVYHYNGVAVCKFSGVTSTQISQAVSNWTICNNVNSQFFSLAYDRATAQLYFFAPFGLTVQGSGINDPAYGVQNSYVMSFDPSMKAWSRVGVGGTATINYSFGAFSYVSTSWVPIFYQYGVNVQPISSNTVTTQNYARTIKFRSTWNHLNSPYIWKDPAFMRFYIRSNQDLTEPKNATLNIYKDYDPNTIVYTTTFTPTNGFADINIGPGCQGHAFMFEIITVESTASPTTGFSYLNTLLFSGYAPAWTEAEVI